MLRRAASMLHVVSPSMPLYAAACLPGMMPGGICLLLLQVTPAGHSTQRYQHKGQHSKSIRFTDVHVTHTHAIFQCRQAAVQLVVVGLARHAAWRAT